jgi:hypothetical protein
VQYGLIACSRSALRILIIAVGECGGSDADPHDVLSEIEWAANRWQEARVKSFICLYNFFFESAP